MFHSLKSLNFLKRLESIAAERYVQLQSGRV